MSIDASAAPITANPAAADYEMRSAVDVTGAACSVTGTARDDLRAAASRSARPRVADIGGYEQCPEINLSEAVARAVWKNGQRRNDQHDDWRSSKYGGKTQRAFEALAACGEFAVCRAVFGVGYASHLDGDDDGRDIDFPAVETPGENLLWDDTSWNVRVRDWPGADPLALWPSHKTPECDGYMWLQELTDGYPSGGLRFRLLGYIRSGRVEQIPVRQETGVRDDVADRSLHADKLLSPYPPAGERRLSPDQNLAVRDGPAVVPDVEQDEMTLLRGDAP